MRIEKNIIMWELSLKCNLSCDFCYQTERRIKQEKQINLLDALKIIDNLPINSHIAFIGGESFLFSGFIEILRYLDSKGLTYEITSNGTLVKNFIEELNSLKNLCNINFSVDFLQENQDKYRKYKGLFQKIVNIIPLLKTKVNINTVIFLDSDLKELIKLHLFFNKLGINEHTFLMYSSFSKKELDNSIKDINNIIVKTLPENDVNYDKLRVKSIQFFKKIYEMNKDNNLKTKLLFIPQGLLINKNSCKHLINQYRINEYGKLSICHYIDNDFDSLVENKFEDVLNNKSYLELKNQIKNKFPLNICKNCCKIL